ncbi:MAG: AAA family ATPase [Anaerolineales bacterium]
MTKRKAKKTIKRKTRGVKIKVGESLKTTALRAVCDPAALGFKTTDELPRLEEVIGQPRAFRALEMGMELSGPGYNVFALGLPGSGKTTLIREHLERRAANEPDPYDWCYVNNFDDPHRPRLLRLPKGQALKLRKNVHELIQRCEQEIQRIFASEEYSSQQNLLAGEVEEMQEQEFDRLTQLADKNNFVLAQTPYGVKLVPGINGEPVKPEELEALSDEQKQKLEKKESMLEGEVQKSLHQIQAKTRELHEKLQELDEQTALFAIEHLVEALKEKYADQDPVVEYLDVLKDDIVVNADQFRDGEQEPPRATGRVAEIDARQRYEVNVLVDNSGCEGAPVIVENHPSYHNLMGRIEHEVVLGATLTNFTLIRPGALHRANGGYLILPAREVLLNQYAWEGLQRALRDQALRIVELGTQLGLLSTTTLEPEPMPLNVKVVLIGTPMLYYMLQDHDEDFTKLFKVKAEFATLMERTKETEREYALFVKAVIDENGLPPFDRTAVARIIEHGSRLAESQNKLSTRFGMIADLIRESAHWAQKEGKKLVDAAVVDRAIDEAIYRDNLIEERLQEMVTDGTLLIDVGGERVGQINALSVLEIGGYAFGRPTRITATVYPGKDGVLDIEREAKLGGPIHTKGVLIISGFLGSRYGQKRALSLSSRITFEQSYDEVEGDSASAAELIAILSALADTPLRQDRAITGSVNQHGTIQVVGGVNEKIEGFFATCRKEGLNGSQGVIVPEGNLQHLMLNQEVVDAVAAGNFHIWPISTVDEGLQLLTGKDPGAVLDDGSFPQGSINQLILQRLEMYADSEELDGESEDEAENGD